MRTRQGSAWVVIVCLVLSGAPVWAQEQVSLPPPGCNITLEMWNAMSADQQASVVCHRTGDAQTPSGKPYKVKTGQPVSPKLAGTGFVVALVGALMMLPHGEEYHILGDTYCVSNTGRDVDYGSCDNPIEIVKLGAILLPTGIVMAWLGMRSGTVTVYPTMTQHMKGASAKITWGGSHARH